MKYQIAVIASALFMALTMTACGSGEPVSAPSVADSDKAAVEEKLNNKDSKADDKQADESAAAQSCPAYGQAYGCESCSVLLFLIKSQTN